MEIKDVNSLVNQILSGKTDLKTVAFESAFAEMVKEKSEEKKVTEFVADKNVSANSKVVKKEASVKNVAMPDTVSSSKKENEVAVSNSKANSKDADKNINEKNVVNSKVSEKQNPSQKTEGKVEQDKTTNSQSANEDKTLPKEEVANEEISSEEKVAVEVQVPFVATPVTETVSETVQDGEGVETFAVAEGEAEIEGSVSVNSAEADEADSEKVASKTQTTSHTGDELMVQPEDVAEAFETFKKAQVEVGSNVKGEEVAIQAEDKKVSKPEKADVASSLVDEKVAVQAEKISEVIGSDKKMKISVEVKEEKIAYSTDKLVNNTVDVANAIEEVSSKAEVKPEASASQTSTQDISAQKTVQANAAPVVPNQAAAAQVVTAPNVSVEEAAAKNIKTADATLSNVSGAQANGKILLNSELAGKEETKATFKDVYKGMSKEAVEQVKVNITKSAVKGIDKINIQLKPEELGTIEVKMQIGKDGKISAHIISNKPETLEILQKDVQSLEKAFSDAGFQTDGQSLSFSYREQQEENRAQLKSFIGDVLGKEAEVANQEYSWNANGGLNIRV